MRQPGEVKRENRINVSARGTLIDSDGVETEVEVLDLSTGGCRLKTDGSPMIGEHVRLRVGRMGDYPGQIRWSLGGEAGLKFTGPIELPDD